MNKPHTLGSINWELLADRAWSTREQALILGDTKVGAALLADSGLVYSGCNVEHRYRSHDVHAEVNAIATMVADGGHRIVAILIVAERTMFTPCGACMDWIFQFGDSDCQVGYQNCRGGAIVVYTAKELMPHYPQ